MFSYRCPFCSTRIDSYVNPAGRNVNCRGCGELLSFPATVASSVMPRRLTSPADQSSSEAAGLVCGIVGMLLGILAACSVCVGGGFPSLFICLVAITLGIISRRQCRNRTLGTLAIVFAGAALAISMVVIVLFIAMATAVSR